MNNRRIIFPLFGLLIGFCLFSCQHSTSDDEYTSWKVYRGDKGSNAYSKLSQINKKNVKGLEVAWTYRTGDSKSGTFIQCNPIIIDKFLYATSPTLKVLCLDAATGNKIWEYDPFSPGEGIGGRNRGLAYWENGEDKRLFYNVLNEFKAINATTGEPIIDFGNNGSVDLLDGLDREFDRETASIKNTSPGILYNDLIILGSAVSESYGALPGHIRAYDVRNGELKWIFHTIPHPGEFGYDSWPKDYYKTGGGANAWAGFSLDKERGILYAPLGAPSYDFYGKDRHGQGLFGNSLVALNAATGEYIWHFQVSHHDLWDYDIPAPPNLITIQHNGKPTDAVAQITKQGFIFLLDRETGEPLFEVEERSVAQSRMEGESTWPTQPFPVKPPALVRQYFDESLVTDISPESRENILQQIRGYTFGDIYLPPSEEGVIQLPGFRGGGEWSGAAFDPESGKMYIGVNDMPNMVQLVEDSPKVESVGEFYDLKAEGEQVYQQVCTACHGEDRKGNISYPSLIDVKDRVSLNDARALLKSGRGMMPSFQALEEKKRRAVLAYLYDLSNEQAFELLPLVEKAKKQSVRQDTVKRYKLKAYKQLRDHMGYPGIKPPWGNLCAVNLNTGEIEWKVPLGEYEELTRQGIPPTGTQLFGGGVVTAGGVVFIGASRDAKFRAIDKDTGKILWEYQLPVGGYATPATYEIEGVQYVVIAAGGGGMQGTESGDYYIAFRLP
ncbi:PQQ-binding-like beta-propeller repeat protein [Reichenbachiella sp. MALMAid0571]|uniref:outer membrane protein assembly factor BamB family protein n=1 Tax=Reichenbachiella sp. MALMAid0571 TaxID=3143939 RepID=UPI0032DF13BF